MFMTEIPADEVIWQNERWAVTVLGLESRRNVEYPIPKSRLLEMYPGDKLRGVSAWARGLAEKSWVDNIDDFLEAFERALEVHLPGMHGCLDLNETARVARTEWVALQPDRIKLRSGSRS